MCSKIKFAISNGLWVDNIHNCRDNKLQKMWQLMVKFLEGEGHGLISVRATPKFAASRATPFRKLTHVPILQEISTIRLGGYNISQL